MTDVQVGTETKVVLQSIVNFILGRELKVITALLKLLIAEVGWGVLVVDHAGVGIKGEGGSDHVVDLSSYVITIDSKAVRTAVKLAITND